MKLVEKYKERLYNNDIKTGGYNYMNDKTTAKLFKDVNVTTFKNLYIQLAIALFDEGFIPVTEKDNIDILREFYKGNSNAMFSSTSGLKHHPNNYFGYLYQKHREISELITAYMKHVYTDIIEEHVDNILYIDTDYIYHYDDLNLDYLDLEYEKYSLDYLILISMKRFVAYSNCENPPKYYTPKHRGMIVKGYNKESFHKIDSYVDMINEELRNDKIDNLINS